MGQDGLLDRANSDRLVCHVVDRDGGEPRAAAMLRWLVDESAAPAACPTSERGTVYRRDRCRVRTVGGRTVVEFGKGIGQILGVDHCVGSILELLLPAVGRRGGRADEEELASVGQLEVLVLGVLLQRRGLAKVDARALAHDHLVVPDLPNVDSGLLIVEGYNDAAEGLERRPGVDRRCLLDEFADSLEVVGPEDVDVIEVGDEQGVCGRRGLLEWRQVGQVEGQGLGGGRAAGEDGPRRRARRGCG